MPMIRSKFFSANARIAGSIEVGLPGSTSYRQIGKSFCARLTPSQAAALNERSFLPPMSKTMPTLILQPSRFASTRFLHDENTIAKHARIIRQKAFLDIYLLRNFEISLLSLLRFSNL